MTNLQLYNLLLEINLAIKTKMTTKPFCHNQRYKITTQACHLKLKPFQSVELTSLQRVQIGQFIALWATFQSLYQQFICPNLPHSQTIFVNLSKYILFLVQSFLGNCYRHLAIFSGHTATHLGQCNSSSPSLKSLSLGLDIGMERPSQAWQFYKVEK